MRSKKATLVNTTKKMARNKKMSHDNSSMFIEENVDIDNRRIHLAADISAKEVSRVIRGIQLMITKDPELPIDIFINSDGGCVYTAFGLYNFIRSQSKTTFRTYNIGCAMSGASIIFLAGDERYMYKDTVFMFHTVSNNSDGGTLFGDMVPDTEETKKLYVQMCKIYAERTNIGYREWYRKLKFQNQYYRAKESLEMEIVDKVIKTEQDIS